MASTADVVVVGAGISGCAAAYYLARRGVRVVVVEKGPIAGEQSSRAWGYVRQQGRHPAELPLMAESMRMWRELTAEIGDLEFVAGGNLVLAGNEEDRARLAGAARVAVEHGVQARLISPAELRGLVPRLEGAWAGALYCPDDAHAEPATATYAFARAAAAAGAEIRTGCPLEGVEVQNGAVHAAVTRDEAIRAPVLVCAAGRWADRVLEMVGLRLPLQAVRVSVAATRPAPPITRAGVWGPQVGLRQRPNGEIYFGNGWRRVQANYDVTLRSLRDIRAFLPNFLRFRRTFAITVGAELVDDIRRRLPGSPARRHPFDHTVGAEPVANDGWLTESEEHLYRCFPTLRGLGVARRWAGYIESTPDGVPVLGWAPAPRGLMVAAGFSGHGFALGPITGRLVAELVCDGHASLDLADLRFTRFAEGRLLAPMPFP